jgi:signal transduction histidine kinase
MLGFARQIAEVSQGQHLCSLYESTGEVLATAVAFLAYGLERGERCVYVADSGGRDRVRRALRGSRIEVEEEVERGSLLFADPEESYLAAERFDPEASLGFFAGAEAAALADGFSGLRCAADMSWALDSSTPAERLVEYEALLGDFFPGHRVVGLCQYDVRRFPPETIYDVLCTHPLSVIGTQVCPNYFYEPLRHVLEQVPKRERVYWRMAQLRRARAVEQALEEANQVKVDFLATMSHDLRTPLNAILGYSELLREGITGPLSRPQRDQVTRIGASARHLLLMINDLLDFSKLEAGRERVEPQRVTLSRLVHEAAAAVRPQTQRKGLDLCVQIPRQRRWLYTDRAKAYKILLNLLSNAVKYTDAGTVTLEAGLAKDGSVAVIRVRDTGRGIPAEHHETIFEAFWRIKDDSVPGSGIGLSVTRRLARLLGGDVFVESEPGLGSTFTFELPVSYSGARSA